VDLSHPLSPVSGCEDLPVRVEAPEAYEASDACWLHPVSGPVGGRMTSGRLKQSDEGAKRHEGDKRGASMELGDGKAPAGKS
jgi:hypothetical protein